MRIGLIVNPIAGLGGTVGLKGTDGPDTVARALRRGAVPNSGLRAQQALTRLAQRVPGAKFTLANGQMGADWAVGLNLAPTIIGEGPVTGTARDTRTSLAEMGPLDLVVFAGGDGTARDIAVDLPKGAAILGIPCGVKMHSGVFAVSPNAAGSMLADIMSAPDRIAWTQDSEIMDIDEDALRAGHIAPRLFGLACAPATRNRMQAAKGGPRQDCAAALSSAASEISDRMETGTLYVIGPGTSAGAVMLAAGHEPSILGVDAVLDGKVVAHDARASDLDRLAANRPVKIVLGVTGRQGFLLGRGNQQISQTLISRSGREGLIILATEAKLTALAQPRLWVDTGDPALDAKLVGFVRIKTGASREMMMKIEAS